MFKNKANGRHLRKSTHLKNKKRGGNMEEIWKDVEGYEGYYQISNLGNIRSLDRVITRSDGVTHLRKGRAMAKRISSDGYIIAKLSMNGKSKSIGVHILVARHFIPNPDNCPEVNHKDCNRKNNSVGNLEWCTHQQNVKYSADLGHYKGRNGELNPNYKNDALKKKYAENPELAKRLLRRPGEQNGRAVPIRMKSVCDTLDFKFIGEAAEYLRNNGYTASKVDTIRSRITESIKKKKPYLGCTFERI